MTAEAQREFVAAKILVYAFDSSAGQKQQAAQALLERLWENSTGCLSVQVLQEFFVTVTKKVAKPLPLEDATSRVREFATWRQRPTMWSPPLDCTPRRASGFGTR
jgi:predicted nucleic acid-binding protein